MRIIVVTLILISNALADDIYGIPKIIDGDTVYIDKYKIRLEGIDAPETKQQCKNNVNLFTITRHFIGSIETHYKHTLQNAIDISRKCHIPKLHKQNA